MCSWKGKRTKELDRLYKEYYDIFGGDPEGYLELEGCYNISYEEYVGYIKECIKEKKALPDIMLPKIPLTEEEERVAMELYREYIALFGKPVNLLDDILSRDRHDRTTEDIDSMDIEGYIRDCIAKKEKTLLSDVIIAVLANELFETEIS